MHAFGKFFCLIQRGNQVTRGAVNLGAVECCDDLAFADARACDTNAEAVHAARCPGGDCTHACFVVVEPSEQSNLGAWFSTCDYAGANF